MTDRSETPGRQWGVDSDRKPRRGDKVLIPKGAWLVGTHSSLPKNAGRTYCVTVDFYNEWNGEVTWAGTGGYWFRTVEWCWPAPSSGD